MLNNGEKHADSMTELQRINGEIVPDFGDPNISSISAGIADDDGGEGN